MRRARERGLGLVLLVLGSTCNPDYNFMGYTGIPIYFCGNFY